MGLCGSRLDGILIVASKLTYYSTSGSHTHVLSDWCSSYDVILLGGGGGGFNGAGGNFYGGGGQAGLWGSFSRQRGTSSAPWDFRQFDLFVGAGAPNVNYGTSQRGGSSVYYGPLGTSVSSLGGVSGYFQGNTTIGGSPGTLTFNGQSYVGGASQSLAEPGNPPGGGGKGGVGGLWAGQPGHDGADGAIWVYEYGDNPVAFSAMF